MKTRLTSIFSGFFATLRHGHEQYRALFEQAADATLICSSSGRILESNPSATHLLGYSRRDLTLMHIADLHCKRENREKTFHYDELLTHKTIRTERMIRCKDFHLIPMEVTAQLLPDGEFMTTLRDISERKKTEQTLRAAIERYHMLARATGDTIWDWDIIANTKIYDPGLKKLFGYDLRLIDNASQWLNDKLHPEDLPTVITDFQHAITNKQEHLELEYRFRCIDGSYKNIFDRSFIIYNANKNPIRMIGSMQDITEARNEEKRIEKAILEAQEKERFHIGQELHDNINQILASAHMTLHAAKDSYHDVAKTHQLVTMSRQRIEEALIEIRKLSHQLAPAVPDGALLKDIFLELFSSIDVRAKYKIDFQFDSRLNSLDNEAIMLNLYRIMQEQLKNIVKYSEAKHIEIVMKMCEKHILFSIRDDGRGFDIHTVKKGIGLNNIRKRVESLSGKLTLRTAPGEGCMLISEIPF
jgi:two-component system sensor histidine kinase UhpB